MAEETNALDEYTGDQGIFEDVKFSEKISNLVKAWITAKLEMGEVIPYDAINPHFKNRFASLEATVQKINPIFGKHKLALFQLPTGSHLVNILAHDSGEWMSCRYAMAPTKRDPQMLGSALTYARRYCAQSLAGVCGGQDDDAEAAMGEAKSGGGSSGPTPESISDKFIKSKDWGSYAEYSGELESSWDDLMKGTKNLNERKKLADVLNKHKQTFSDAPKPSYKDEL